MKWQARHELSGGVNGGFLFDIEMSAPMPGLTFHFRFDMNGLMFF